MTIIAAFLSSAALADVHPQMPTWLSYGLVAIGAFVVLLSGLRILGARLRSPTPAHRSRRRMTLSEAAELAYQRSKRKRLAVVAVAERAGSPEKAVEWFANNIFCVVPVRGRRMDSGRVEVIKRARREKLCVVGDGNAIGHLSEEEPRYTEVYVESRDLEKYMKWARSVH